MGNRLPSGYQEVEWIQSSGTQWIDTQIKAKNNLLIDSTYQFINNTTTNRLFGGRNSGTVDMLQFGIYQGNYYPGYNDSPASLTTSPDLLKHKLVFNNNILNLYSEDEALQETYSFTNGPFTSTCNIGLFCINASNNDPYFGSVKIFNFSINDNGNLTRNFIPCYRKSDSVTGMYDKANSGKNLFDNSKVYSAIVNNATHFRYPSILVHAGKTYTFSTQAKTSANKDLYIANSTVDDFTGTVQYATVTPTTLYTVSPTVDTYYCAYFSDTESSILSCTACKAMCEEGSTATSYEPYPFYTNQGTGTFTVGPEVYDYIETYYDNYISVAPRLPESYQEVEYIQSSGTQYIDTGITPTETTNFEIDAVRHSSGIIAFGCRWSGSPTYDTFGELISTSTNKVCVYYGRYSSSQYLEPPTTFPAPSNVYIKLWNNKIIINTTDYTITRASSLSGTPTNLMINEIANIYGGARYKSVKIWDNETLIRNFIPCYRKLDSVAGMYDLCNSGKNLFDKNNQIQVNTAISDDGSLVSNSGVNTVLTYIPVESNTTYTLSGNVLGTTSVYCRIAEYDQNKTFISRSEGYTSNTATFTTGANTKYIRLHYVNTADLNTYQLEEGSTATEYEPYPFYTNQGTGSFVVGPDATPTTDIQTYKEYYVAEPERNLPVGYTELEYIEAVGSQSANVNLFYINTNIAGSLDTEIETEFKHIFIPKTASNYLFTPYSSNKGNDDNNGIRLTNYFSGPDLAPRFGNIKYSHTVAPVLSHTWYYTKLNKDTLIVNDVSYTIGASSMTDTSNIYIMCEIWNQVVNNTTKLQMKNFIIRKSGVIVFNGIPCIKDSNSEVGMYDKVTNTFYGNSGTGTFTAGPLVELPDEYQEVTYLQSSGEQYIDTGYSVTSSNYNKIKFEIIGTFANGINNKWQADGIGYTNRGLYIGMSPENKLSFGNCDTTDHPTSRILTQAEYTSKHKYILDIQNGKGCFENEEYTVSVVQGATFSDNKIYLFTWDGNGNYQSSKKYSCKIWNNGTLVRNFIPCYRKQDNKPGMYDLVTKQFYTNANTSATTDFTVGADVVNIVEVYECFYIS